MRVDCIISLRTWLVGHKSQSRRHAQSLSIGSVSRRLVGMVSNDFVPLHNFISCFQNPSNKRDSWQIHFQSGALTNGNAWFVASPGLPIPQLPRDVHENSPIISSQWQPPGVTSLIWKVQKHQRMERNDGFTKITLENFCFFVCHQHACSWQHLSYHSHAWSPCFKHMLQGWQQIVMEFLQQRCRCQALSTRGVLLRVKSRVKFHGPLVRFASTESANLYFGIRPLCYLVQHSSIPG